MSPEHSEHPERSERQDPTTYWDYIRIEELLGLQGGLEPDDSGLTNDEVLFITVHQIYELWFKLILRELRSARDLFGSKTVAEPELSGAVRGLRRITTILQRCNDHWNVIETLQTRDYLAFRDKLTPASGFQSFQLRQIEILAGLDDAERIKLGHERSYKDLLHGPGGSDSIALRRVEEQLADMPTLKQAIDDWLYRTPIGGKGPEDEGGAATLDRFVARYLAAFEGEVDRARDMSMRRAPVDADRGRLHARFEDEKQSVRDFLAADGDERRRRIRSAMVFIVTHPQLPLLAWPRELLAALIEFEQMFVVFRQRHARMVERVIGRRTGTGGSAGVDYLDETALKYRIFRDLWAVRSLQVRGAAAPELENERFYDFVSG